MALGRVYQKSAEVIGSHDLEFALQDCYYLSFGVVFVECNPSSRLPLFRCELNPVPDAILQRIEALHPALIVLMIGR